jgi:predicted deacetylase
MSTPVKRARPRKALESNNLTVMSHADHLVALHTREQGKTVMYKQDAWGHIETRFVRTQNVPVWEAKGFTVR